MTMDQDQDQARRIAASAVCVAIDYGGTISDETRPLLGGSRPVDPACVPVLRALAGRGLALILSSNTADGEDRWPALRAAGISDVWRAAFMSASVGVRKPDPAFYRLITAAANCWPDQVLHIGNNLETDILGPQRFGMHTALVRAGGAAEDERAMLPPGTLVIAHLRELPALLGWDGG